METLTVGDFMLSSSSTSDGIAWEVKDYGTGGTQNCIIDYWQPWERRNFPYDPNYITTYRPLEDKGRKAIEMADMLIKKDLVKITTAKQLMKLLDELLKIL